MRATYCYANGFKSRTAGGPATPAAILSRQRRYRDRGKAVAPADAVIHEAEGHPHSITLPRSKAWVSSGPCFSATAPVRLSGRLLCDTAARPRLSFHMGRNLLSGTGHESNWRRGRDLNPRYGCPYAAFRVRCDRPLCHLSGGVFRVYSGKVESRRAGKSTWAARDLR
jgi:hypothetical protein